MDACNKYSNLSYDVLPTLFMEFHGSESEVKSQADFGFTTDVCVPVSKLTEVLVESKRDIDASSLVGPIVGHVGDGNFHCIFVVDSDCEDDVKEAEKLSDIIVRRALAAGGTCTGEHGVGLGKRKYLEEELGKGTIDLMKVIKKAVDPKNIMNPGKILESFV